MTVVANVRHLDHELRRMAIDTFGVRMRILRPEHDPRFTIEASIPLDGATPVSTSTSTGHNTVVALRWTDLDVPIAGRADVPGVRG